jgi:phage baseplate assembly protein W
MTSITEDFVGRGWAFPLRLDSTGAFALSQGDDDVAESIRLILGTSPGERPMRPEFGSRLRDFVFRSATIDTAAELAREVENALLRWEPRIAVHSVNVMVDRDDRSRLYVDLDYVIKGTNDRRNLVFPFYTIPADGSDY